MASDNTRDQRDQEVEPHTGDRRRVDIHGLGASGDGVGRLEDGRVVFVEEALPGDRVEVVLGERRKKVQYARLVEVLVPSPERVVSRCTVDRCGGCPLAAYSAAGQARAKLTRVVETLRRIGHLDTGDLLSSVRQVGDGWGYRHRVRLHAAWSGADWNVGYYARRSRTVRRFSACPVLIPELTAVTTRLAAVLASLPRQAQLGEIDIAFSRRDGRAAARLTIAGPLASVRGATAQIEAAGLSGLEVESPEGRWRHGNLELRLDHARAAAFGIRFEPGVFTQAHPAANDALVAAVVNAVRPREAPRVLELHAGVGNFSLALANAGARLVAVEVHRRAAILCRGNARRAGCDLDVVEANDVEALNGGIDIPEREAYDLVVMDPPRTGAAAATAILKQRGPRRLVYVSCDPATLARDAACLGEGGYELRHLEAFDMFPQTPHVEVLAVFERS